MIITTQKKPYSINFGATGKTAKIQNIDFALSAFKGSMFLHRDFGWAPPIADAVSPEIESTTAGEITELLMNHIEDIEVGEVDFEYDGEGNSMIYPKVEVELLDG